MIVHILTIRLLSAEQECIWSVAVNTLEENQEQRKQVAQVKVQFREGERETPQCTPEPEIHSFSFYQNTTSSGFLEKYKPSVKPLNEIKGMDSLEGSVEQFKY